jgi:hypothetical protein
MPTGSIPGGNGEQHYVDCLNKATQAQTAPLHPSQAMTESNLFSGEFCADLLTILEQACSQIPAGESVDKELLKLQFIELVDRHDLELPVKANNEVNEAAFRYRGDMKNTPIRDFDRLRLNAMLPWSSYNFLGEGKGVVGGSYNNRKRYGGQPLPDVAVTKLDTRLGLDGKTVIEAGCFEGHHSISLAACGARVWGFDSRIENIIKSLTRAWFFGYEHAASFDLINLECDSVASFYADIFSKESPFCFHSRGVLYHLKDPVSHLMDVAKLNPCHIYLHTQIASEDMATEAYETAIGTLAAYRYREKSITISPFSGMENYSLWLTEASLIKVLSALGYGVVEILMLKEERNGPRIELIASKQAN